MYSEVFLTQTEVFPCFFLSCKANARVKLAKTGHGPHSSKLVIYVVLLLFVLFCVLFVCKCVLYYCHRVTTQLQSTNIPYIIIYSNCSCVSLIIQHAVRMRIIWPVRLYSILPHNHVNGTIFGRSY